MRFFIKAFLVVLPALFFANPSLADDLSSALQKRMSYLGQSQAIISKNLANSNTPGYKAMELQEPSRGASRAGLTTTSPMHISGINSSKGFKAVKQKDTYETAPNGNNVSIEEQMVKMSENNMEHQIATNLLRKVNGMVGIATGQR